MPIRPSALARRMSAASRTSVSRSSFWRIICFIAAMLSTVWAKPSQTDTVQLAAVRPARRMSSNTDRSHLEMMRPSMTTLSRCRAFDEVSVVGSRRTPRPVTGHQGGARRVLEHSSLKAGSAVSPAGRYLVQIRHGRLSSSDKRRPRQAGRTRGSAGIRGVGSKRGCVVARLAGHGMPARRMARRATIDCAIGRTTRRGGSRPRRGVRRGQARPRLAARRQDWLLLHHVEEFGIGLGDAHLVRMNSMDCTSSMSWMNLQHRPSAAGPARSAALRGGCRTCSG